MDTRKYNKVMAISPRCDACSNELTEFGAILLSPPNEKQEVKKSHLCKACYAKIAKQLNLTSTLPGQGQD
jgi:hypothetical protein